MPLDPLAKRFLVMMAAAQPGQRLRPTVEDRRAALAKLMQFARPELPASGIDGSLPGPAGDIPYRLYAPAPEPAEEGARQRALRWGEEPE